MKLNLTAAHIAPPPTPVDASRVWHRGQACGNRCMTFYFRGVRAFLHSSCPSNYTELTGVACFNMIHLIQVRGATSGSATIAVISAWKPLHAEPLYTESGLILQAPCPNPFNPKMMIRFEMSQASSAAWCVHYPRLRDFCTFHRDSPTSKVSLT